MTIAAYVLLGDPEWLVHSIGSYYPHVDRIVASYDVDHLSWSGLPMRTQMCLDLVEALDVDNKVDLLAGHFAAPELSAEHAETRQRQAALDAASEGSDWVLQLDTDEIVPDWGAFEGAIRDIDEAGLAAVWFPQRVLHAQVSDHLFFTRARRRVLTDAGHPAPMAIRAGSHLSHRRQDDSTRVLLPRAGRANRIPIRSWILHFNWVRSLAAMREKAETSGHAQDFNWRVNIDEWARLTTNPTRGMVQSMLGRSRQSVRPTLTRRAYREALADFDAPLATDGGPGIR